MHHEAALEMCGNTTDAAKRNEQQADLATVSVTVVQHIFRDILNGGIFACRSPREVVIHPTEDTFGFQVGVGFTGCQFGSKFAQARGKDDMLLTLGSIFLIKSGRRIIGLHVFRLQIMPFAVGGKLKGFGEYGRFAFDSTFLHVQCTVTALGRRKGVLRFTGRNELDILLPGLVLTGIGQPATDDFPGRYGIGIHGQRVGDAHALRLNNGLALLLHSRNDFGQVLHIHFLAATRRSTFLGYLDVIASGVHTKQIRSGIAEIAFLSIQHHALQSFGGFPLAHLLIGHVGNILADIVLHLGFRHTEIRKQTLVQVVLPIIGLALGLRAACRSHHKQSDGIQ